MTAVFYLDLASVVVGFTAAGLWLVSTKVRVAPEPNSNEYVVVDRKAGRIDADAWRTLERQVVWNSRAALATAIAVSFQALKLLVQL